jgi:hypothetical protein
MARRTEPFRAWLITRVSETGFAVRQDSKDATALAKRLGLQPEIIEEATKLKLARAKAEGRQARSRGGIYVKADRSRLMLRCAPAVYEHIKEYCAIRRVTSSALLRGLIQTFLLQNKPPKVLASHWVYQGKVHRLLHRRGKAKLPLVGTDISRGAMDALGRRAARLGATKQSLARGLVIDLIEGRTTRVVFIEAQAMWNDPNRYWRPECQNT